MGAAEGVKGPGGGLKAAGVEAPARATPAASGGRPRRNGNGNGTTPATSSSTIAAGTTSASVLTGELRNQIDRIWDAFWSGGWSGGISNPLEVLEQLTYLLFIRRLDELEALEERKAQRSGQAMARRQFPEGRDARDRPYDQLRWSRLKQLAAAEMFELLAKVVDLLDAVPMADRDTNRDTKGDIDESMLGKLATAGSNGQFSTPRHIIELMVAMTEPSPRDVMVDPA